MQGYKAAAIALVVAILVFAAASVPPTGAAAPSSGARRLEAAAAAAAAPSPASAAESGSNAWLGWLVGAGGCVAAVAALVFLCSEPQDDDGDTVGSNATNAVRIDADGLPEWTDECAQCGRVAKGDEDAAEHIFYCSQCWDEWRAAGEEDYDPENAATAAPTPGRGRRMSAVRIESVASLAGAIQAPAQQQQPPSVSECYECGETAVGHHDADGEFFCEECWEAWDEDMADEVDPEHAHTPSRAQKNWRKALQRARVVASFNTLTGATPGDRPKPKRISMLLPHERQSTPRKGSSGSPRVGRASPAASPSAAAAAGSSSGVDATDVALELTGMDVWSKLDAAAAEATGAAAADPAPAGAGAGAGAGASASPEATGGSESPAIATSNNGTAGDALAGAATADAGVGGGGVDDDDEAEAEDGGAVEEVAVCDECGKKAAGSRSEGDAAKFFCNSCWDDYEAQEDAPGEDDGAAPGTPSQPASPVPPRVATPTREAPAAPAAPAGSPGTDVASAVAAAASAAGVSESVRDAEWLDDDQDLGV